MAAHQPPWWQPAVVYQIYPRSFQDSNGDGVGDLAGIAERADYLQWLGVDAVWVSPFYPSPMADFGYDVSDYIGVDPIFGRLADFDRLTAALHERNIRIISTSCPITARASILGSRRRASLEIHRSATGTSGATLSRMAARRTTG
jgi:alpha-glucosidase